MDKGFEKNSSKKKTDELIFEWEMATYFCFETKPPLLLSNSFKDDWQDDGYERNDYV